MAAYPRLDLPLPLELVNTRFASSGRPVDALETPTDLDAWVEANIDRFQTSPPRATPMLLERFRALRAALAQLLGAAINGSALPPLAVQQINDLSAASPRVVRLDLDADRYQRRIVDLAGPEAATLATVARATIELLAGADRARLRRCGGPGCVLLFLSDRRSRAWCSDACGNRARVARHYVRHRRLDALRTHQLSELDALSSRTGL
jgi:predicted RNA-binding Zn ribbon-like protein